MRRIETHIAIQDGEFIKDVAKVTYLSSGGFMIHDLLRSKVLNHPTWVAKLMADNLNHGIRETKPFYQGFTTGMAKYSHHSDGRAQISGEGVLSGFFEDTKEPKGASVHSFSLDTTNDTGPFAGFNFWGLEKFHDPCGRSLIIPVNDRMIHNIVTKKINSYELKFFYIPKKVFTPDYIARGKIWFRSAIELWVDLYVVPSPESEPGFIGIYVTRGRHGFKSKCGFTFMGAPGKKEGEGGRYSPSLVMVYPSTADEKKAVNLNWPQPR